VLAKKVEKIINWFTENTEDEIAALGVCELRDGALFVEDLVFPKQEVTSGSVKFGGADWKPIIKQVGLKNLHKIMFHWHKHPGDATPSLKDEEETFETFAENRDLFGFLITGKVGNKIDMDARIILNKPIKAEIEAEILTEQDNDIEEECKKIIEERVRVPKEEVGYVSPNGIVTPFIKESSGKINIVFQSCWKEALELDLEDHKSLIKTRIFRENKQKEIGVFILTPSGKLKKLRKAVKDVIKTYQTEGGSQKELEDYKDGFSKCDAEYLKYLG
jgi:hypothetical protein